MEQDPAPLWVMLPLVAFTISIVFMLGTGVLTTETFLRKVKANDEEAFTKWGKPSFFSFNPLAQMSAFHVMQLVARNKIADLDNSEYQHIPIRIRKSLRIAVLLLVLLMVFGLYVSMTN